MKQDRKSETSSDTSIKWEDSYEGQLRKLVGNRPLIIAATRSVVMDSEGRVLLIRRKDSGEWGLPAGALEPGESILDCCKREVREETGLEVTAATPIAIYSEPRFRSTDRHGNQRQMLAVVFLVKEWTGQIRPRTMIALGAIPGRGGAAHTDETTDCRFFEMDNLPPLPPLYAETMDDVRNFKGSLILK